MSAHVLDYVYSFPQRGPINYGGGVQPNGKNLNLTEDKTAPISSWLGSGCKLAASLILGAILFFPLLLPMWCYRKGREWIGCSARKNLKDSFVSDLQKQFKLSYQSNPASHRQLFAFEEELAQLPSLANNATKMRAKIVELSKHPVYQQLLRTNPDHAAVKFLQDCGEQLESTDGTNAFCAYGKAKLDAHLPEGSEISLSEYALAVQRANLDKTSNREGRVMTAFWGAMNPAKVAHIQMAYLKPLDYDSYQDHTVFLSKPLIDGDHVIQHKYTPGLTGCSSIVESVLLPKYAREGRRWVHIDNQSMDQDDERVRIDQVHQWSKRFKGTFFHAVISTDTPARKAKEIVEVFTAKKEATHDDVVQFFDDYALAIRGENDLCIRNFEQSKGIHIPTELLSKSELDAAYTTARTLIMSHSLLNESYLKTHEGREELALIIDRHIGSTLAWAIMKKEQFNHENSTFTENCKENLDRGPSENQNVLINEGLSQGKGTISREDAHLNGGIILGRADITMDRAPLAERLYGFVDRTIYIDAVQDAAKAEYGKLRAMLMPAVAEPVQV